MGILTTPRVGIYRDVCVFILSTPFLTQFIYIYTKYCIFYIGYWNNTKCEKQSLGISIISNNKNSGAVGKRCF